jgi:aryl-alcohol dehydrogenase-like predicted oxidoreductase
MQPHYNLLYREGEREMLGLCQAEGAGILPWSPLVRGLTRPWETQGSTERTRTDQYGKGLYGATQEADKAVLDRLGRIAEGRGLPRAQVALAWLLRKPAVTAPIVGATKPQHLEDAVGALAVKLPDEEVKALEEPYVPHPLVGFE